MQTTMALLVVAARALVPAAETAPLERGWVSAEAQWMVHADVEAWNASTIGRFVMEHAEDFDIDLDELDDFKKETGIDPREDLFSVTVYGWGSNGDERLVVVAVTTDKADEALERLQQDPKSRKLDIAGNDVYTVPDADILVHLRPADRGDRRIAVMSEHKDSLEHALAVIAGREPGLTIGCKPALAAPRSGSFLFAAASSLDELHDVDIASEVMKLADAWVIDLGEQDGLVHAYATASAASAEDAGNITQIIKGILALGALMFDHDGDMAPLRALVDAVDVHSQGKHATVGIRFPVEGVIGALEEVLEDHDD